MASIIQLEDEPFFAKQVENLCSRLEISYFHAENQMDFENLIKNQDVPFDLYIIDANVPMIAGMHPQFILPAAYTIINLFHGPTPTLIYTGDTSSQLLKTFVEEKRLDEKNIVHKIQGSTEQLEAKIKKTIEL